MVSYTVYWENPESTESSGDILQRGKKRLSENRGNALCQDDIYQGLNQSSHNMTKSPHVTAKPEVRDLCPDFNTRISTNTREISKRDTSY